MNQFMNEQWPIFEGTHGMRNQLLESLSDADLAFNPGGKNVAFGAVWRELGEIEHSYIQSLKNLKQDWSYRNTEPGLETSKAKLKAWYDALDAEMKQTVEAFSDEDLKQTVDRGSFSPAMDIQLQVYLQAILIFFGKATIFIRAMNRPLSKDMQDWIG